MAGGRYFEEALVVGSLLAPEGGAAYCSAIRYWGWIDADERDAASERGVGSEPVGGDRLTAGPAAPAPLEVVRLITPRRVVNMHPRLLGVQFELVHLKPERVCGIEHLSRDGLPLRVTGRERTVVDMMDRSDLCGGLAAAVAALRTAWPRLDRDRLVLQIERFGSGTVPKRLGYLVERLGLEPVGSPVTERLHELIAPGYSVLERGGPSEGGYVRRWMVRVNVSDGDLGLR